MMIDLLQRGPPRARDGYRKFDSGSGPPHGYQFKLESRKLRYSSFATYPLSGLGKAGRYRASKVYIKDGVLLHKVKVLEFSTLSNVRYINNGFTDRDLRMPEAEESLYGLVSNLASLKYYFIEASSIILPLLSFLLTTRFQCSIIGREPVSQC